MDLDPLARGKYPRIRIRTKNVTDPQHLLRLRHLSLFVSVRASTDGSFNEGYFGWAELPA